MPTNAIEVRNIYKTYADGTSAVKDVSFDVPEGSCFGFLGPNGAGKTTLMKMLYGMVKRDDRAETQVNVLGFDPKKDELAIKHLCGVVPQDNNLDAEARRFWGRNLENENTRPPEEIILYSGRGGKTLLTLADCLNALKRKK